MVKNTTGGNKSKGFARKNNSGNKDNNLRVAIDEGEVYAIVTKMCGNGMFECYCIDKIMRLCQIRGKFTGKGKRDNIVSSGTWVLIGVREWDIKPEDDNDNCNTIIKKKEKEKLPKCDLLEVYNDGDKEKLRAEVPVDWKILIKHDPSRIDNTNGEYDDGDIDGGFKFSTEKDIERALLLKEAKLATSEKIKMCDTDTADIEAEIEEERQISIDDL